MLNPPDEQTELKANSVPNYCLIGALDNPDVDLLIDRIKKWRQIRWWKIGHQAIASRQSTRLTHCLHDTDCNIFMDIKLWDTPRTVMATIKASVEITRFRLYLWVTIASPKMQRTWQVPMESSYGQL